MHHASYPSRGSNYDSCFRSDDGGLGCQIQFQQMNLAAILAPKKNSLNFVRESVEISNTFSTVIFRNFTIIFAEFHIKQPTLHPHLNALSRNLKSNV